jgi:UrcA family protein
MAFIAAGLSLALSFTPACAQPSELLAYQDGALNSRTVRLSDLDLTSVAGAKRLANRIKATARDVCEGDSALARTTPDFHQCVEDTIARAAAKLDAPLVNAALGLSRKPGQVAPKALARSS